MALTAMANRDNPSLGILMMLVTYFLFFLGGYLGKMVALCRAWILSTGLYALCLAFRYQPKHHRLGRRQPE